ncbi:MAG: hypothetical protein JRF61_01815 [Deltaproteobacteria bacterium]|jgi:hypothetical protein|nr:hypothetical protein [Deltaproteobacteria bacterium]
MPVLPLMDLMLLAGWTSLFVGFVLKLIYLASHFRPTIAGLTPIDFLFVAVAAFLFAIALAARTWVKSQEPGLQAARRQQETMEAWRALPGNHTAATHGPMPESGAEDAIAAGAKNAS